MFSLSHRFGRKTVRYGIKALYIAFLSLYFITAAYAQTPIVIEPGQKFAESFVKLDNKTGVIIVNHDVRSHKLIFHNASGKDVEADVLSGSEIRINLTSAGIYDVKSANHPAMSMTVYVRSDVNRVSKESQYYY